MLDARAREVGSRPTRTASPAPSASTRPRSGCGRSEGSRVIGGTVIGRVGQTVAGRAAHVDFSIRPAGRGRADDRPEADPGRLEAARGHRDLSRLGTQCPVRRGQGRRDVDRPDPPAAKPLLSSGCCPTSGSTSTAAGATTCARVRSTGGVLAGLAYLAESGLEPSVTSLSAATATTNSGNVSHHSSGNAVDISAVNGVPILGHQEPGGITEQTVRRLRRLQGTMAPAQIISLLDLGGPTMALSDHGDHIHLGFQPRFGDNRKLGRQAMAVLEPGQWSDLIARLRDIENPVVPTAPSKYALPARPGRAAAPPTRATERAGPSGAVRLRPARVRLPVRAGRRPLPGPRRARRNGAGRAGAPNTGGARAAPAARPAAPCGGGLEPAPVPTVRATIVRGRAFGSAPTRAPGFPGCALSRREQRRSSNGGIRLLNRARHASGRLPPTPTSATYQRPGPRDTGRLRLGRGRCRGPLRRRACSCRRPPGAGPALDGGAGRALRRDSGRAASGRWWPRSWSCAPVPTWMPDGHARQPSRPGRRSRRFGPSSSRRPRTTSGPTRAPWTGPPPRHWAATSIRRPSRRWGRPSRTWSAPCAGAG